MVRNLKPDRGMCLDALSANSPNAAVFPSAAQPLPNSDPIAAIAMALVSAAILIAYAALLPRDNLPASVPALGAVLLASTLSSIAGFAFSAICGVMLLHMMSDPLQVVETMMVCSIAIQSLSVAALWRDVEWRELLTFLIGGTIGLPFGVWLLLNLGHVGFRQAVGALLTAYAAYALLKRPVTIRSGGNLINSCVGFLGGITGGLAGFPGAAVTIWCGMRGWDKRRQRGVYQPFILVMQVLALLLIQIMRPAITQGAGPSLVPLEFVPVALLGTWFGLAIFRRLSDRNFTLTVNLLLLASGAGLLV
jgi:uncharacterized protein